MSLFQVIGSIAGRIEFGLKITSFFWVGAPKRLQPSFLRINPAYGCVIGIEIQSERYNICGIDLAGEILFTVSEKLHPEEKSITDIFNDAVVQAFSITKENY